MLRVGGSWNTLPLFLTFVQAKVAKYACEWIIYVESSRFVEHLQMKTYVSC